MADDWTDAEIDATVRDYFTMMEMVERGERFVKTHVYKALEREFPERSWKAFERKFCNISAVLDEMGRDWIPGLKPMKNYQSRLRDRVRFFLEEALPNLPEEISRDVLIRGIERIDRDGYKPHHFNHSYDVVYQGQGYPPIAVVSFAMEELEGRPIPAGTYEGGKNTRTFAILEKAGLGPASKAEPGADQDELFNKAVGDEQAVTDLSAPPTGNTNPRKSTQTVVVFERDREVVAAVLAQANGYCELCGLEAPFTRAATGTPYLEVHHVMPLSKDGDDTVQNSVALCPNCHRRCHYSTDSESTTEILYQRVSRLERQVATDVNL